VYYDVEISQDFVPGVYRGMLVYQGDAQGEVSIALSVVELKDEAEFDERYLYIDPDKARQGQEVTISAEKDGTISDTELLSIIGTWASGEAGAPTDTELLTAIATWSNQ